MSVSFQIIPSRAIVYVAMSGDVSAAESFEAFGTYAQHSEFRPFQNQLIDLTQITDFERNFPELMKMQAKKADILADAEIPTLLVYLAPTPISVQFATAIIRSWTDIDRVVVRLAEHEEQALDLLGQPETTISDLLKVGT